MNNIRQKINQLRVAYFRPNQSIFTGGLTQTGNYPRAAQCSTKVSRSNYNIYQYHPKAIGYVMAIPSFCYGADKYCNFASSAALKLANYSSLPALYDPCYPRIVDIVSGLQLHDYSMYLNQDYRIFQNLPMNQSFRHTNSKVPFDLFF